MAHAEHVELEEMGGAEIIPLRLAITAMRDSGYKNTAYALAELIDNAIQADASMVEVLCIERRELVSSVDCTLWVRHGIRDSRLPWPSGAAAQQPLRAR